MWHVLGFLLLFSGCYHPPDLQLEEVPAGVEGAVEDDTGQVYDQVPPPITYNLPFMSGESFVAGTYAGHVAWDFNKAGTTGNQDCGEPVIAVATGRVEAVNTGCPNIAAGSPGANTGCGGGLGNYVRVDHDSDNDDMIYAHLQQLNVVNGQWIEEGQVLGLLGTSGNSSACHLHFEMRNGSNQAYLPLFIWDGGSGGLTDGVTRRSINHHEIDLAKVRLGIANVANQTTTTATRLNNGLGYKLEYRGGAFGDCAIYYEALGCVGGNFCPSYNNTNFAWLTRGAIRATYNAMGATGSWLGFPTGNEYAWSNGQRQNFRNGYLYWNRGTGVTTAFSY